MKGGNFRVSGHTQMIALPSAGTAHGAAAVKARVGSNGAPVATVHQPDAARYASRSST